MRRRVAIVLTSLFAVLIFCSVAAAGDDDDSGHRFTDRSIQGKWGFSGGGTLFAPLADEPTEFSNLGTIYFDGEGNCVTTVTANIAGTVAGPATSDSCIYSVNPDGTGTSTARFSDPEAPESSSIAFVVVDRRRELRAILTDPIVGGFVAKRQSTGRKGIRASDWLD